MWTLCNRFAVRAVAAILGTTLCTVTVACTNAYRVDPPNYSQLADSKDGRFRITTREGQTYVVKRFVDCGDSLLVLERDRRPGFYDVDGVTDPEPPFGISVAEIDSVDEIRFDGKATAVFAGLGVIAVSGLVVFILMVQAFGGLAGS